MSRLNDADRIPRERGSMSFLANPRRFIDASQHTFGNLSCCVTKYKRDPTLLPWDLPWTREQGYFWAFVHGFWRRGVTRECYEGKPATTAWKANGNSICSSWWWELNLHRCLQKLFPGLFKADWFCSIKRLNDPYSRFLLHGRSPSSLRSQSCSRGCWIQIYCCGCITRFPAASSLIYLFFLLNEWWIFLLSDSNKSWSQES